MNTEPGTPAAPQVVILAGPNGAGKSTYARLLLPEGTAFLNADEIAKTLTPAPAVNTDREAGRLLLGQMDALAARRASFAVETTLSSRSLAPRIAGLRAAGYLFRLFYIYLPSADLAVARVAARVRRGGHAIPTDVVHRRYERGLRNFFTLYRPLADRWRVYQNVGFGRPRLVASGGAGQRSRASDPVLWAYLQEKAADENKTNTDPGSG